MKALIQALFDAAILLAISIAAHFIWYLWFDAISSWFKKK